MRISLIVAMGLRRQIGLANKLPWHISSDLKNFKKITMGHTLIFGRKTFESIGRALPGRRTIIVSRDSKYTADQCEVVTSVEAAIKLAHEHDESEVFIAGGAEIYRLALPLVDRLYLSLVHYDGEADTYFPELDLTKWTRSYSCFSPEEDLTPAWTYEIWDR